MLVPPPSRSPGLVGVVCPGPSWLVPSCSFRMCLTTAVALKACCRPQSVCHLAQGASWTPLQHPLHLPNTSCTPSTPLHPLDTLAPPNTPASSRHPTLTFHLLFAKFFLICSLTDWWMFLSRAVSPAILRWEGGHWGPPAPWLLWGELGGGGGGGQMVAGPPLPGMLQGLLASEALAGVFLHQVLDEVFGWDGAWRSHEHLHSPPQPRLLRHRARVPAVVAPAHPSPRCRPSRASQTRTRPAGSARRAWHRSRRRKGGNRRAWGWWRWGRSPRVTPGGWSPVEGKGVGGGYVQDVGDDPNGPAIHCLAVGLLRQHLGGWGDNRGEGGPQPCTQGISSPQQVLTHVAGGAAGRGHDAAAAFDLGQPEVTDHDLGVLVQAVIEQVLGLRGGGGEGGVTPGSPPRDSVCVCVCVPGHRSPSGHGGQCPCRAGT